MFLDGGNHCNHTSECKNGNQDILGISSGSLTCAEVYVDIHVIVVRFN